MARIAADPGVAWHTEMDTITPTDPSIEAVVFATHTLVALVYLSVEMVKDALNIDSVVANCLGD